MNADRVTAPRPTIVDGIDVETLTHVIQRGVELARGDFTLVEIQLGKSRPRFEHQQVLAARRQLVSRDAPPAPEPAITHWQLAV